MQRTEEWRRKALAALRKKGDRCPSDEQPPTDPGIEEALRDYAERRKRDVAASARKIGKYKTSLSTKIVDGGYAGKATGSRQSYCICSTTFSLLGDGL